MTIVILGPAFLLFYVLELQPEMNSKAELDFVQNTEVPVKFGDNVLVLPIRKDVKFSNDSPKKLKMKMQEGPVKTNHLEIRGYKYGCLLYTSPSPRDRG